MDDDLFEHIKQFVEAGGWEDCIFLTFETTLEGDLRITGDDAAEFIIAFGKAFNVDVSEFDLAAYFGGEGGLMGPLPTPGKIPLTLGNLYEAASTGIMYETDQFKQIIQFIKDRKPESAGPYIRKTELYRDLKLWANDARVFIDAFAQEFNVDIADFDFNRYFHPPKDQFILSVLDYLLRKKLTLGDLESAMIKKKLI